MSVNIFSAVFGGPEKTTQIVMSTEGPWYGDMYRGIGDISFYQIRAQSNRLNERTKTGQIQLRFLRTGGEQNKLMASDPLLGEWWTDDNPTGLRVLSAYKDNDVGLHDTLSEFHEKIWERVSHGYRYRILCLHPRYAGRVRTAVTDKFGEIEGNRIILER